LFNGVGLLLAGLLLSWNGKYCFFFFFLASGFVRSGFVDGGERRDWACLLLALLDAQLIDCGLVVGGNAFV